MHQHGGQISSQTKEASEASQHRSYIRQQVGTAPGIIKCHTREDHCNNNILHHSNNKNNSVGHIKPKDLPQTHTQGGRRLRLRRQQQHQRQRVLQPWQSRVNPKPNV